MRISTFTRQSPAHNTMNSPVSTERGRELSLDRRYAMAVEIAMGIPPSTSRSPAGFFGPLVERYGVGELFCETTVEKVQTADRRNWGARSLERSKEWTPVASYSSEDRGAAEYQQAEEYEFDCTIDAEWYKT